MLTGLPGPARLALDRQAGRLYWADRIAKTISRVNLDGSGVETLFSTPTAPISVAIDPRDVDLRVEVGRLTWDALPATVSYDVVRGDLGTLRATGGDFALATSGCVADNAQQLSIDVSDTPDPGQGIWYVVRGIWAGVATPGSWNACSMHQAGSRDDEINSSGAGCL